MERRSTEHNPLDSGVLQVVWNRTHEKATKHAAEHGTVAQTTEELVGTTQADSLTTPHAQLLTAGCTIGSGSGYLPSLWPGRDPALCEMAKSRRVRPTRLQIAQLHARFEVPSSRRTSSSAACRRANTFRSWCPRNAAVATQRHAFACFVWRLAVK